MQLLNELGRLLGGFEQGIWSANLTERARLDVRGGGRGLLHFKFLAVRMIDPKWWSSIRLRI